jgi:hypothetical protein
MDRITKAIEEAGVWDAREIVFFAARLSGATAKPS